MNVYMQVQPEDFGQGGKFRHDPENLPQPPAGATLTAVEGKFFKRFPPKKFWIHEGQSLAFKGGER